MRFLRKIFFSYWYWRQPPWDTNITPPEVIDFISHNPPGRALDLGCGTGTNAITLAQNGWRVTGVDFIAKPIRAAQKKARQANLTIDFIVADVTRLEMLYEPFDLILDIGCYHNLSSSGKKAYRSNVNRLLKVGGSFMLYAFFSTDETDSGRGVTEADLVSFSPPCKLISRQDGLERGKRPSVWLTLKKIEG